MSSTRTAATAGALLLVVLASPGPAAGTPSPVPTAEKGLAACLAPIQGQPHSADVIQGWIDGCRAEVSASTASDCPPRHQVPPSADVIQGWIEQCRRSAQGG